MPIYECKCEACGRVYKHVLLSTQVDPATLPCGCGHRGMKVSLDPAHTGSAHMPVPRRKKP